MGVSIDPAGAVQGASIATKAAQGMQAGVTAAVNATKAAASATGATVRKMGQDVAQGAKTATQAIVDFATTGAWAQIQRGAANAANSVVSSFGRMRAAASSLRGIGFSNLVDMANAAGLLNNPLGQAISRFESFRRVVGTFPAAGTAFAVALGGMAAALAAVGAAAALTFAAIDAAGPVQRMQVALTALTGSAKQADAIISAVRANALKTGADLQSSLESVNSYVALGFSPADAVKLDKNLADIAGSLGLTAAKAKEVAVALVQVKAQGTVAITELRDQIAEKGVPIMDELAKKLKVSQGELLKMVSAGKVQANDLIDIFLNMEGGFSKFAGGAEKAALTLPGALAKMKATWTDLLVTIGEPINDALTPFINQITERMGVLSAQGAGLGEAIAASISTVGPIVIDFIDTAVAKFRGFQDMLNSADGLGITWARNMWVVFVDYGLSAVSKITAAFATLGEYLLARFTDCVEFLARATTPEFWAGIGVEFDNLGLRMQNALIRAAQEFLNTIINNAPKWLTGSDGTQADFSGLIAANNAAIAANSNLPRAEVKSPDLSNLNNGDTSLAGIWKRQSAGMDSVVKGTIDKWKAYATDKATAARPAPALPTANGSATEALSTKGSASNPAKSLDDLKKAQKEAEKLQKQMEASAKKYIENNQTPLEKYSATVAEINRLQTAGLLTVDQAARASTDALKKLNDGTKKAAEEAATPLGKLMIQWSDLRTSIGNANRDMVNAVANDMTNAISGMIQGTTSVSEAFANMAKSILNDLTQIILKLMIQWAISSALGMVTGTPTMPTTFTAASASTAAGVHHTGGTIGSPSVTRTVPVSAFASAPRFQHGGTIGSGERPVVAEPGEVMLTRDKASDIRARLSDQKKSGPSSAVSIVNVSDPAQIPAFLAKNPGAVLNVLSGNKSKAQRILDVKNS